MKIKGFILMLFALFLSISVTSCTDWFKSTEVTEDPPDPKVEQLITYQLPTVEDVLEWRDAQRREQYLDSIYMEIPDEVLRFILTYSLPTDTDQRDISLYYLQDTSYLTGVRHGIEYKQNQEKLPISDGKNIQGPGRKETEPPKS